MNERKLSELQKEYRAFFLEKMRLYGVKSPAQLTKEKKSEFFTEIKLDWAKNKPSKKQINATDKTNNQPIVEEPIETYKEKALQEANNIETVKIQEWPEQEYPIHPNKDRKQQLSDKKVQRQEQERTQQAITKLVIKSEPNLEQTDDLRILFTPNNHFIQEGQYRYPVVKMPKHNTSLKLPREGRSVILPITWTKRFIC